MLDKKSQTTMQQLSNDERIEYTEIGQHYRHDDALIHQLAAVLLPLSFGSVAIAAQFPNVRYPLAVFSIILYLYWFLVSVRLSWFSSVRLIRARELENKAGLNHHRILHSPPSDLTRKLGSRLSIRRLRLIFLFVLIFIWTTFLIWVK